MSYEVVLLVAGILLIIVGLVGKVKFKEVEVGARNKVARLILGLLGAALTLVSFNPEVVKSFLSGTEITQPINQQDSVKLENESKEEVEKPETSTQTSSTDRVYSGIFKIRVQGDDTYLHEDGGADQLLSTRYQADDDFSRFRFELQSDGTYFIRVVANNRSLHEDGLGNRLVSTLAQETDDFSRFYVEQQGDGSVKIKVKGDDRYWGVAIATDSLVSTRDQTDNGFSRFYLEKQ